MANRAIYFHDCKPVVAPKLSGTVISAGDFIYAASAKATPAASQADAGTKAGNQEAFHDAFWGIAMEDAASGTTTVKVATAGVWEVSATSGTYTLGQYLGVDEQSSGTALENQIGVGVATANLAIGQVREATTGT